MNASEALQQELHQITLELGLAFIDHKPKPDLANDARAIKAILELAERRPAVRTALGITLSAPAWHGTRNPTPPAEPMRPLVTVPEQAAPDAEREEGHQEAARRRDRQRKTLDYPKRVAALASAVDALVASALDPASPDLTVEPEGEINARRRERLAALRAWAVSAGLRVAPNGPIPPQVREAYQLARQLASKAKTAPTASGPVLGAPVKTSSLEVRQEGAFAGFCRHPQKVAFSDPTTARLAAEQTHRDHVEANPQDAKAAAIEYGVYQCGGGSHYHFGKKNPFDKDPSIPVEEEAAHNIAIARRRRSGTVRFVDSASAAVTA